MHKVAIFILLSLAVQMQAKRVKVERLNAELENEEAEAKQETQVAEPGEQEALQDDDAEEESLAGVPPEQSYWYTSQDEFKKLVPTLMHSKYTQQFELVEEAAKTNLQYLKDKVLMTKKYDAKLEQYEDPSSHDEVVEKMDTKVLRVETKLFTMHGHQSASFLNEQGVSVGEYIMFNPKYFARHYTWRVAAKSDPKNILFTIQKRLYDDHCKHRNMFSCHPILKIYVGKRGDKSTLIYYGVGDKDLYRPSFKFYHSKTEHANSKENWAATVDHEWQWTETGEMTETGESNYKVKVKPNEDAALLLLASVCLDRVGDDERNTINPLKLF